MNFPTEEPTFDVGVNFSVSSFGEEFSCSLLKCEILGRVCGGKGGRTFGRSNTVPILPLRSCFFSVALEDEEFCTKIK